MDFKTLSESRYSARSFSTVPVEQAKLEAILLAGQVSPTACNMQPQRVLAVHTPKGLETVKKCTRAHFGETLAIITCYDKEDCWERWDGEKSGVIDASIVTTHMMLAAHELGVCSTWVMDFIPKAITTEFSLPKSWEPVSLLLMGYPAKDCRPSRLHSQKKPLEETVTYL